MINITLKDGSKKSFSKGISVLDIAKSISEGFARNVISAKFNDIIIETSTCLVSDWFSIKVRTETPKTLT